MTWQSNTIDPSSTTPADDISKIKNDLQQLRSVIGGGTDSDIPCFLSGFVLSSVAAVRALDKTKIQRAVTTGYYTSGDGGGAAYYLDTSDTTSTDNGGTIIVATDGGRWKMVDAWRVNIRQFGAVGDGSTNDRAKIQAAVDWLATLGYGLLIVPPGRFRTTDEVVFPAGKTICVLGHGRGVSVIDGQLAAADSSKSVLRWAGTSGSMCKSVGVQGVTVNARYFGKGIKASYCYPKLTITDVDVWKPVDDGIYIEECWGATLKDCFVDGDNASVGSGIVSINANAVTILNPRVYNMKSTAQARGIYATSAESLTITGGNIENCPRGVHVQVNGTYDGPVTIEGIYFEPRGMSPWDAGQPNDHILIEGDTSGSGVATVRNCLFQPGNSGVPIAFNGVTARNLACLTMQGNVWQKAKYTTGGQGENYMVDADATVAKLIRIGNFRVSTSLGNLDIIDAAVQLTVDDINDGGAGPKVITDLRASTLQIGTGATISNMLVAAPSLNFGSIAANSTADLTVTMTGADANYLYTVSPQHAIPAGVTWAAYWDAGASAVKVRISNVTTSAKTVSGAFRITATKIA